MKASQTESVVFGIYMTRAAAEAGIDALKSNGFRQSDVSILFPNGSSAKDPAHPQSTKAPETAALGAGTGVVIGGILGWLVGAGTLAIPGAGPFIAAGPLSAALASAGAGGTVGVIAGSLAGWGIPESTAKQYEDRVKSGGRLLSVHCSSADRTSQAKQILERTGAQDVLSAERQ